LPNAEGVPKLPLDGLDAGKTGETKRQKPGMDVVRGLDSFRLNAAGSVLTIGNFDGVHRGHQQLLAQGCLLAADTGQPLVVLTFEPHPLSVVSAARAPTRLMTLDDKLAYLAALGAERTVVAESNRALLGMEAECFVRDVVVARFRPSHIVEGPSFGFGRGRRGNVELLRTLGQEHDFELCVVGPIALQIEAGETVPVSSSLVRRLLEQGRAHQAALCLGRPYRLAGTVVPGHRRGRALGYPTANLAVDDVLIPEDGVYSGLAGLGDLSLPAAVSIGTAPTFGAGPRQIEAYLLDFEGDVYGQRMRLDFLRRLRPQETYRTAEALIEQMKRDVAEVRRHAHDAEVERNQNRSGSTPT